MSVMTDNTFKSDMTAMIDLALFESNLTDCDGITLNVGDAVVEAVMTANGVQCPKMSDSPEEYRVYAIGLNILDCHNESGPFQYDFVIPVLTGLERIEEFVLIRSVKSGEYIVRHMSELSWIGDSTDM